MVLNAHRDIWNKVETYAKKVLPDDEEQEPMKQTVATTIGNKCSFRFKDDERKWNLYSGKRSNQGGRIQDH